MEKTCTRCLEDWPADDEFFRPQPRPGNPTRLAPWCRACESERRDVARRVCAKLNRELQHPAMRAAIAEVLK